MLLDRAKCRLRNGHPWVGFSDFEINRWVPKKVGPKFYVEERGEVEKSRAEKPESENL